MATYSLDEFQKNIHYSMSSYHERPSAFIEVTVTNKCNLKCDYCFENIQKSDLTVVDDYENKVIKKIQDFISSPEYLNYNDTSIIFWGGEPFLNTDFVKNIINATRHSEPITYSFYSNATLYDRYADFVDYLKNDNLKNRVSIQLSYDGDPHNQKHRGTSNETILKVADLLEKENIRFNFKATLKFESIDLLPEIWDSYKKLYDRYGDLVAYAPTLDTNINKNENTEGVLKKWFDILMVIAKKEKGFIKEHQRSLLAWFNANKKFCNLPYNAFIHTDGNFYKCHGCPYLEDNCKFKLGSLDEDRGIDSIFDRRNYTSLDDTCLYCEAMMCNVCHVTQIDSLDDWLNRSHDKLRCEFFKVFALVNRVLNMSLIKERLHG